MRAEEAKSHYNQRILINKEFEFEFNWYFTISVHLKSGLIRWVASVEEDN
jgi:hypothetical protein